MKKFRKMIAIIVAIMISSCYVANAQVSINTDDTDPNASAMLDVKSTDKGFLPPRVANVNDVSNPVAGLLVYDQSVNCMRYYTGTDWSECMGKPFSCGDPFMDSRDGQSYATVQIGTQCWMAENLNIGTRIDGSSNQTNNSTIEKYCFDDNTSNCDVYGGLYQWNEMMQYVTTEGTQGICPTGWHIPTDNEWTTLTTFLGGISVAGGKMKETGTVHWISQSAGATNESGFTGLPGGYHDYSGGTFQYLGYSGYWWSSSEYSGTVAWNRNLHYSQDNVTRSDSSKDYSFSVRCLKD